MHGTKALIAIFVAASSLQAVEFSGTSALQLTSALVAFGPRPAGSAANQKQQTYIHAKLRSFGCTATEDRFQADTPLGAKEMKNLIVRIPGASGKAVVISGHYDTKLMPGISFVGADDGGSSAGFLLEMARTLCHQKEKNDVYLVWLDGEEAVARWTDTDSLYGSRHLAAKWQQDGTAKRIVALINVDMIGDADLSLVKESSSNPAIRELVWKTAAELGYSKQFPPNDGAVVDDHVPFLQAGIPALDLIDFDYGPNNGYWHTEKDTVDKLSASSFEVIGKTLLRVIKKLEDR